MGDRLGVLRRKPPSYIADQTNTRVLGYHGLTTSYSLPSSVHFPIPICFDQHLVCTQTSRHHARLSIRWGTRLIVSRSRFHCSRFPPQCLSAFVFLFPFVPTVWTLIIVSIPRIRCHVGLFSSVVLIRISSNLRDVSRALQPGFS